MDDDDGPAVNPFLPPPASLPATRSWTATTSPPRTRSRPGRPPGPSVAADAPPKLRLLARGLAVFGSYAKVLEEDGVPAAYVQFGPLSAYPRALRTRELYPKLPVSPLPAVITCISTTANGTWPRPRGHAGRRRLRRPRRPGLRGRRGVPGGRCPPRGDQRRRAGVLGAARVPRRGTRRPVPGRAPGAHMRCRRRVRRGRRSSRRPSSSPVAASAEVSAPARRRHPRPSRSGDHRRSSATPRPRRHRRRRRPPPHRASRQAARAWTS